MAIGLVRLKPQIGRRHSFIDFYHANAKNILEQESCYMALNQIEYFSEVLVWPWLIDNVLALIASHPGSPGDTGPQGDTGVASLVAIPGNLTASGIPVTLIAHENQGFGDACFINAVGEAEIASALVIASASATVMCTDVSVAAGNPGNYIVHGIARQDTWAWVAGGLVFLATTGISGSTLTQISPSLTDEVIQVLGVAMDSNRIYFNPQLVQVEHT